MKLTLLSLLVFGLVAFTFAAPVMEEEEDEDQVDPKSVIVEGPDKPINEVIKIDKNDDGEDTPLSDEPENEVDYVDNDPAKKTPKKTAKKLGKARRRYCFRVCKRFCYRTRCSRCYRSGSRYRCYTYSCYRCYRLCYTKCIG